MPGAEWPPTRKPNETADAWMSRLESGIKAKHSRWVDKLAHGDESAMDIVLHNILPPPELTKSEIDGLSAMPDEEIPIFVDFLITENMTFMEEVRSGNPDAVNEYITGYLEQLQYDTAHQEQQQPPEY